MANAGTFASSGYRCGICAQKFHHPSLIYCCDYGHIFCQKCFAHADTAKDLLCPRRACKAQIFRMDTIPVAQGGYKKKSKKGKKMFPEPHRIAQRVSRQDLSRKSVCSLFKGDSLSTHCLSSKRPINCPYPGCKKNIAIANVGHHFKCEHRYVALISTYYENRNGLEFNPYDVRYNENLCIVLISIIDESGVLAYTSEIMSFTSLKLPLDPATTKPVMLVMATRIPFHKLYEFEDSSDCEELEYYEERGSRENNDQETSQDNLSMYNSSLADKILVWVASNVPTTSKYTLAISNSSKLIRLKYNGTISQINDSATNLCERGKGLILSEAHTVGMTCCGRKPLTVDIIVHKEVQPGRLDDSE